MDTTTPHILPGTLITTSEVQNTLRCCRTKVWMLAKEGHLTAIKLGIRMTRFKSDEVLQLMERGI